MPWETAAQAMRVRARPRVAPRWLFNPGVKEFGASKSMISKQEDVQPCFFHGFEAAGGGLDPRFTVDLVAAGAHQQGHW